MKVTWPWLALAAAGAFHGLNPAMGWLFAVDVGMQERSRRALMRSLPFIALRHALSIGLFVVVIGVLGILVDSHALQLGCAGVLIGFGMWKAFRWRSQPGCVGSRVGSRALVAWSFLMATSHGTGLMLVPILLHVPAALAYLKVSNQHVLALGYAIPSVSTAIGGVAVHTAAMLSVATMLAVVVYETVGVAVIAPAWRNLDLPWAASLVGAGVLMAVL